MRRSRPYFDGSPHDFAADAENVLGSRLRCEMVPEGVDWRRIGERLRNAEEKAVSGTGAKRGKRNRGSSARIFIAVDGSFLTEPPSRTDASGTSLEFLRVVQRRQGLLDRTETQFAQCSFPTRGRRSGSSFHSRRFSMTGRIPASARTSWISPSSAALS